MTGQPAVPILTRRQIAWERDGILDRIQGAIDLVGAPAIASSMR